jgi:hypothetical protein
MVYSAGGWSGVCLLGAGFGLLTVAMTLFDRLRPAAARPEPVPSAV